MSHYIELVELISIVIISCGLTFFYCFLLKRNTKHRKLEFLNKPCQNSRQAVIFAFCSIAAVWFFQRRSVLWQTTDDLYISCVINSVYAEENYCIFINPILSKLVKYIDVVFPQADGLILLKEVFVLTGLWCTFYILSVSLSLKNTAIFVLSVIALNSELNLLHLPFTSLSGELFCYGFFIVYAVFLKKVGKMFAIIGTVLIVFSCLWRFKAILLVIPFVLLIMLAELIEKKDREKKLLFMVKLFLPAVLLCTVCVEVKSVTDSGEKYNPAVAFNIERSQLVDYPNRSFEECKNALEKAGISENDFSAGKAMILADTDTFTTDFINKINSISYKPLKEKAASFRVKELLSYVNFKNFLLLLIIAAAVTALLLSDVSGIRKWESILTCVGGLIICIYFIIGGHFMEYVMQTILLYILLVLIVIFLSEENIHFRFSGIVKKVVFFTALLLTVLWYSEGTELSPENSCLTSLDNTVSKFTENESSEDAVYVWGVYDFSQAVFTSDFMKKGKLFSQKFIEHNLVDGEWMYSQPYYLEYLRKIGMENPMKALIERENTYYVANKSRCEIVLTYMQEHFSKNITAENIAEVGGFPVWKFSESDNF